MAKQKNQIRYRVVGGKHHMEVNGVMTSFGPGDDLYFDPKDVPEGLRDRLIPVLTGDEVLNAPEPEEAPEAPENESEPVTEEPPVQETKPKTKRGKKKGGS